MRLLPGLLLAFVVIMVLLALLVILFSDRLHMTRQGRAADRVGAVV